MASMTELDLAHAIMSRGLHLVSVYFTGIRVGTNMAAIWKTSNGMLARGGPYFSRPQILTPTPPKSLFSDSSAWGTGVAWWPSLSAPGVVYWINRCGSGASGDLRWSDWIREPGASIEYADRLAADVVEAGAQPVIL